MQPLEEYQRAVAAGLRHRVAAEPASFALTRTAVLEWATLGLRSVCPLTTALLDLDGRLQTEISVQLDLGGRPTALHRWGRMFSRRLLADHDPLVAAVARLELITLGDPHALRTVPDPWLWTRQPEHVIADLLTGVDPRRRPPAAAPVPVRLPTGAPSAGLNA